MFKTEYSDVNIFSLHSISNFNVLNANEPDIICKIVGKSNDNKTT